MFDLSLEMLRVVENAAIASARTMGMGDRGRLGSGGGRIHAAVPRYHPDRRSDRHRGGGAGRGADAVHRGEGRVPERTEIHSLWISRSTLWKGRTLRNGRRRGDHRSGGSEPGGLLHAPDCYMEKIIVGPPAKGAVDLDAPVKQNLKAIARRLERGVDDLVVVVLDRPRHEQLIADIREAGARIRLISDGDLSAGIAAAVAGTGVHAVMGSGGAPEGVLTAAALRCLNGEILGPAGSQGRRAEGADAVDGDPRRQ